MRVGGRLVGQGARFGGLRVGRIADAARRRLRERLAARTRSGAARGAGAGAGEAGRRLSLAERLRIIEGNER